MRHYTFGRHGRRHDPVLRSIASFCAPWAAAVGAALVSGCGGGTACAVDAALASTAAAGAAPESELVVATLCGDGKSDPGEACDDANADEHDGCTEACEIAPTRERCVAFAAAPAQARAGGTVSLVVRPVDPRIPYLPMRWSISRGQLADPTAPDSTFSCFEAGTYGLVLDVPACPRQYSFTLSCLE